MGRTTDNEPAHERVRFRSLRILGNCEHCGMPLPIPGPVRKLYCTHCQRLNTRGADFWVAVLSNADRFPDYDSYEDTKTNVRSDTPPMGLAADAVDAPDWLVSEELPAIRFYGAAMEGPDGELEPVVPESTGPVAMSCPKCAAALEVAGDSDRTITCEYCQTDVYLPDPLWQQIHPVQQAEWWYVEYRGESLAEIRAREINERHQTGRANSQNVIDLRPLVDPAQEKAPPTRRGVTVYVVLALVLALGGGALTFFLLG